MHAALKNIAFGSLRLRLFFSFVVAIDFPILYALFGKSHPMAFDALAWVLWTLAVYIWVPIYNPERKPWPRASRVFLVLAGCFMFSAILERDLLGSFLCVASFTVAILGGRKNAQD